MVDSPVSNVRIQTLDFIQQCLVGSWDSQAQIEVDTILQNGGPDWQEVVRESTERSLGPAIYLSIKDLPSAPLEVKNTLHKQYIDSGVNAALLLMELSHLLRALNENQIDIILLKGIGLLDQLYKNPALRPMQDMDLLIDEDKVQPALQIIQAQGYILVKTDLRNGFTLKYENEVVLYKPGLFNLFLDLHWYLFDSPHYQNLKNIAWFRETAQPVTLGSTTARTLSTEAQILYLSGHLTLHHGSNDWIWMRDLAYLIACNQNQIDWSLVLAKAQELELILPLKSTLPALSGEWRAPIPETVLDELSRLQPSWQEEDTSGRLTRQNRGAGRRFLDDIRAIPRFEDKARFMGNRVFPSPKYMMQRYKIRNRITLPLYYLYRWFLGIRSSF